MTAGAPHSRRRTKTHAWTNRSAHTRSQGPTPYYFHPRKSRHKAGTRGHKQGGWPCLAISLGFGGLRDDLTWRGYARAPRARQRERCNLCPIPHSVRNAAPQMCCLRTVTRLSGEDPDATRRVVRARGGARTWYSRGVLHESLDGTLHVAVVLQHERPVELAILESHLREIVEERVPLRRRREVARAR